MLKEETSQGRKERREGDGEGRKEGERWGRKKAIPPAITRAPPAWMGWYISSRNFFTTRINPLFKSAAFVESSGFRTKSTLETVHILIQLKKLKPKSKVDKVTWQVSDWGGSSCPITKAPPFTLSCLTPILGKILNLPITFKCNPDKEPYLGTHRLSFYWKWNFAQNSSFENLSNLWKYNSLKDQKVKVNTDVTHCARSFHYCV